MELKIAVAEQLANSGDVVKERVIAHLAAQELDRRTEATIKVVSKIDELEKELKKLSRPDVETFDMDGKALPGVFSKARTEEIKKVKEQKEKLDKALTRALAEGLFDKVFEVSK